MLKPRSLNELDHFIRETDQALGEEVVDYDGLVRIMGRLVAVRERQQVSPKDSSSISDSST